MGLLRVHIQRGVNLAVRDVRSSDPYIVIKMGKQVKGFKQFLSAVVACFFAFLCSGFLGCDGFFFLQFVSVAYSVLVLC